MTRRRIIVPAALRGVYARWRFAPAVVVDGLVFCSGIVGTSVDGEPPRRGDPGEALDGAEATTADADAGVQALVAVRDPEAQFATAFEALAAILAEAGAGLSDLVEITTYHVDMGTHWDAFIRARDRYLVEPYPAWTAIGVASLIVPGGLMEIRAVAELPAGKA
ncbi:2-aminomuconate deaminase [Rhizobiaceae bacterium]|nr:2-aminomuconate deaminase [Rhizobiaceae bacterium]